MSGKVQNLTAENLAVNECQDHVPELKRPSVRDAWAHTTTPSIRRMSKMEPRQSVQYRRMSQVSRSSVTGSSIGVNKHIIFPMKLQNTYKLEPDPNERFKPDAVHHIIQEVLDECLDGEKYNPTQCRNLTQMLTDLIKGRIKDMNFSPRYKYIVTVTLGQDCNQGMSIVSRGLWNKDTDSYAEGVYAKDGIFAVATVYACYYD